jgi:hypothetical protein
VSARPWLLVFVAAAAGGGPPRVELEPAACAAAAERPRVCAQAEADRAIARVRAVFRAGGTREYWATEMTFDGVRYCAWLPRPLPRTKAIEYYVEAFDADFEISRTRAELLSLRAGCPASAEVAPAVPSAVTPAAAGQRPLPPGFDPASMKATASRRPATVR